MTERTHPPGEPSSPRDAGILPGEAVSHRDLLPGARPPLPLPDPKRPLTAQDPAVLLAMCVFGEARGESDRAQRAIAQVVLNRAKYPHPVFGSRSGAAWEDNLRRVILRPGQFSSFDSTDPNYSKLLHPLDSEDAAVWERCLRCAEESLAAKEQADTLTANSDHYFDDSIEPPSWADPAKRTVHLGRLNFYRLYLPCPTGLGDPRTAEVLGSAAERSLAPPTGPSDALSPARSPFRSAETLPSQEPPTAEPGSAGRAPCGPTPTGSGPSPAARLLSGAADATQRRASLLSHISPQGSKPSAASAPQSDFSDASAPENTPCRSAGDGVFLLASLPGRVPPCAWIPRRPKPQRAPRAGRLSSPYSGRGIRVAGFGTTRSELGLSPESGIANSQFRTPHSAFRIPALVLILLSVLLAACSDFERRAYRTLAVTQAEYETLQRHVAEAAVRGLLTEEQWERFRVEGHRFLEAHNAAVDAFQAWSRAQSQANAARLEAVLEILPRLIRDLNELVRSLEEKKNPEDRIQEPEAGSLARRFQRDGVQVRSQNEPTSECHPEQSEGPAFLLASDSWLLTSS